MEMRKAALLLSVLVFAGGPTIAGAEDAPPTQANQQSHYTDPANTSAYRNGGQGTPMAVLPPTGWTTLSGKVQGFDRTSQTLQVRDKAGNLFLVPMDSQVTIHRNGKEVKFTHLHRGDTVRLHMTRSK